MYYDFLMDSLSESDKRYEGKRREYELLFEWIRKDIKNTPKLREKIIDELKVYKKMEQKADDK